MLEQYFKNIYKTYKTGDATEASYYSDLKILIEDFLKSKGKIANITIQPRKTAAGIPDFTIRKGKELIGYIEAKDLTIEDLQIVEDTKQIKRYKEKLPNFILTNYFDFWLWRKTGETGQWIKKVRIGMPVALRTDQVPYPQKEEDLLKLLDAFISFNIPEKKTAKSLAQELASRAQMMPEYIVDLLNDDKEEEIDRIYNAFKEFLISGLSKEDFADIYAQTITYGLFTARLKHNRTERFNRFLAQQLIPQNIQILHDTFSLISSQTLPENITWIVDDIATILAYADIEKIKKELHRKKGGDDPLMHFYETFLAVYDPKKRKARGVYYTPLPVVSYITRSINILLKEKFGKNLGFANDGVTLLDPASGTLTFPANAIMIAKEEIDKSSNAGSWLQIVKNHILKDYFAFELLMAPYIIGHLKTFLLLEGLGYSFENNDRFKLYLTNTLDFEEHLQSNLPGFPHALTAESKNALEVKKETPILVIMGNPPYSSSHSEQSRFVKDTMKDYLTGLGVEKEKKKGVMQDDYIRFIRFAHWKIEQAGQGIIGMITNNSYLDGIIHRAMRKKILDDFDEIYILNLHGNSRLKEKTPEGKKDENVFDIQQGVSIILLIKKEGLKKQIKYFDSWGLREEKYKFLETHDFKNTKWQDLKLSEQNYFFVPKDMKGEKIYEKFISLKDIFEKSGSGVITRRDNLVISTNINELKNRIQMFLNKNLPKEIIEKGLSIQDTYEWSLEKAQKEVAKDKDIDKKYFEYLYRPLDKRWIIYHESLISRPSALLRQSFFNRNNIGLICGRGTPTGVDFNHVFVSNLLADIHSSADQSYVFPLYIYNENEQNKLFDTNKNQQVNFSDELWKNVPTGIEPEKVFNYIYAILYSNIYRKKYNEFLKIDFPKIPFTKKAELFYKVVEIGKELVDSHLLKSKKLENINVKFPVIGNNRVEKRDYNEKEEKIYINKKQYFEGVKSEIWNYHIGGYQVLDKWLKDRIGKTLSPEDVNHYLRVITVLEYTIKLQKEIDKIYPEVEKYLI